MTFQSHNPATGELIGTYPEHDEAETNARFQRAWEGWLRWSRTPLHERRACGAS
jgi:acyl-CoA reductase-like NAD-dependent aldehyde dehydrogenase